AKQSARAIQLIDRPANPAELPLVGSVAAGAPIEAMASEERFSFFELFGGSNNFVLQVRGTSMIEDHIDDGDYVVIRQQDTAENGERVVVMIDNEVTLKRFYRAKGQIRLEPANGSMEPILVDPTSDTRVLGVLVGVLRKC